MVGTNAWYFERSAYPTNIVENLVCCEPVPSALMTRFSVTILFCPMYIEQSPVCLVCSQRADDVTVPDDNEQANHASSL